MVRLSSSVVLQDSDDRDSVEEDTVEEDTVEGDSEDLVMVV